MSKKVCKTALRAIAEYLPMLADPVTIEEATQWIAARFGKTETDIVTYQALDG
jgi:hypothetical protein